ncbi:MAG TPA: 6-bladed beta-propeller [Solirubrobacteraceae bacterium]|nr:6-bladed beta-propeller [Solirubrobacteraceae bacterium]
MITVAVWLMIPGVAFGEDLSSPAVSGSSSSLVGSPMVVQGVQSLDEAQQAQNASEAQQSNPEAVAEREVSRTRFEGLDSAQAMRLVSEAFPAVVSKQDGGPPPLATGEKALGFESANVEQIETGAGDVGVVQSTVPMAVASGGGHLAAVNLALREAGGGFEAQNPLVPVRVPKHLAEGAQSGIAGVSLTPVDEHGRPLGGSEGVADGTGVFFGNTQTDTDTVLKPSSMGLEASTILRSVESPGSLYYRVGMPQGAHLVASSSGPDAAEVTDEGVAIATIKPPAATDAAGTLVPVSMSVSGDTLVLSVKRSEGTYQYPILVDPELSGYWQEWSNVVAGNWEFHEWIGYKYEIAGAELRMKHEPGSFQNNDYAIWSEKTKGYTKIFDVYVKDELYPWSAPEGKRNTPKWLRAYIEVYKPGGGTEGSLELSGSPYRSEGTVCGAAGCAAAGADAEGNAFSFTLTTKEAGSTGEQFYAHDEQVSTGIAQEHGKHSTVSYNTGSSEIEGEPNMLAAGGAWIGPHSGKLEYSSEDGGLGVSESWGEVNGSGGWEKMQDTNFLPSGSCAGIQCNSKEREVLSYNSLTNNGAKPMPEPEAHVRVSARSSMPYSASNEHGEGETILKVDTKPPHEIILSGLSAKGPEDKELELGEIEAHFKVEATDGEGSTTSSGIKSIGVAIDGHEIGKLSGHCSPGKCTASNDWSVNGAELGIGAHVLTVAVLDNAGNLATKEYELTVYAASPATMGPGSFNPESGDFALEATDVDLSGGMGSLSVMRHYDSLNTTAGTEGPLGPQWTIGLGSLAKLEVLPDNSVLVIGPEGLSHFSLKEGGGFEAPEGDNNLSLEYEAATHAYLLKNPAQGTTTEFTRPEGSELYMATASKGPVATDTMTDEYTTLEVGEGKKLVEPSLELAPHPTATCAHKELEELASTAKGCRALEFAYYASTTATGEAQNEWGGYKSRLKEIVAVAYNPATGKMAKTHVAAYEYDRQGRLRAEWNPEVSPALRTTYGYDAEGHVTALAAPGQQPWIMRYGAIAGDPHPGRLMSITRPGAATVAWNGKALANTAVPVLSTTTPSVGTTLTVSGNGTWSNGALAYSYQWEDCNPEGKECQPIVGAVNQSYTPQARDAGYTLVAQVTAANAGGAQTAATAASKVVPLSAASFASAFGFGVSNGEAKLQTCTTTCRAGISGSGTGQFKEPNGTAVDAEGNVWIADKLNNRIEKFSPSGSLIGTYAPDSMLEPEAVAFSPVNGNIYVSNTGRDRIDELSPSGSLLKSFGEPGSGYDQLNQPDAIAFDSSGNVWAADTNNDRLVEFSSGGAYMNRFGSAGTGNGQFTYPTGVTFCNGTLFVVDSGNNRVEKLSSEGQYEGQFGKAGSGNGEFATPSRVACEPTGNDVYVTDKGNNRVQEFTTTGVFIGTFGAGGHESGQLATPLGVAVGPAGVLYVADSANNRVEKWTPTYSTNNPLPAPPSGGATSVSTVEYGVPISGSGAPHEMGAKEVKAWAQKDDPVYATATFPPDEPVGWPAKDYTRATIYYMDNEARTVNTASPAGGVTTSEYNEADNVVRSLTAANRVTALKETCLSETSCKSAELAELLDTKSTYAAEGTQLTETLGPQHMVKLASGKGGKAEETLARSQAHYYYDEDAPGGETHDLVTKTVDDAETTSGEEFDKRTSLTSYSGQKGLGWKLRLPTSTTTDPTGLDLTKTTEYNEATGNVIETKAPGGTSVAVSPPVSSLAFGKEGTGNGQFKRPTDVATDSSGDVWVNDRENGRVEKLSASGSFIGAYGSKGSGTDQVEGAWYIAVNQTTGNVYIADSGNNRIDELSPSGAFIESIGWGVSDGKTEPEVCKTGCKYGLPGSGEGQLNYPLGLAIDAHGNMWVADENNSRVEEFSEAGAYLAKFGSKGAGNGQFNEPDGLAIDEGEIYVSDYGNKRVEEFSPGGSYLSQFGGEGSGPGQFKEPTGIAVNPNNSDIYVADESDNRVEEFSPAGKFLVEFGMWGTGQGQFQGPAGVAVNAIGDVYVSEDYGDRVDEWVPPGAGGAHMIYSTQFGSAGSGSEQFNAPVMSAIDGQGNVWVTDFNHARVKKFTAQGKFLASYGSYGTGEDQFGAPTGIAINQGTGNAYIADCEDNRIEELSSSGAYVRAFGSYGSEAGDLECPQGVKIDASGDVWVADNHNDRIEEFSSTGGFLEVIGWGVSNGKTELEVCKSSCKAGIAGSENGQFNEPNDIAISGSDLFVADSANHRIQELSTSGTYISQFGSHGNGGGQFDSPESLATDASGHLYVVDFGNERVQELSTSGQFLTSFGSHGSGEGQLNGPRGIAISAAGDAYVTDTEDNRVEVWAPSNQSVHDTKTIYYSAKGEAEVGVCQNHPEWVNLPCQTEPATQPEDSPKLPVTTISYNMWNQAETTTETFGSGEHKAERTRKTSFDAAGRPLTTKETASAGESLPEVTDSYNTETGALETQNTPTTGKTITSKYNTLGQLVKYTDADGATTTYTYEEGSDGRLEEIVMDGPEGETEREKGKQTYSYNATTGFMEKLIDSSAGTFTAGYDVEGHMTTETYPNGMTAKYTRNSTGQSTGLEYQKTTHCTEHCTWFSDNITPSVHGETLAQTSSLSKENYAYDTAARLTEVQETPANGSCTARLYAYNEESDRTSLTTRKSGNETCPTEGGTVERHSYDEANRNTDEEVTYDPFGDTTKLPAADAGQYALTSTYYVDGQVASQTQNEKTLAYGYDPEGRTREIKTTIKTTSEPTIISHYASSGNAVAWTSEGGNTWTRNILGIDGSLTATHSSTGATELQLHDLEGNIVATAGLSETETKLIKTYNSTEFGVPSEGKEPPKYAWLGADGVTSELPSGTVVQDGSTYVPLVGRPLQTEPVELPLPVKSYNPYERPNAEGATWGPIAAALRLAESTAAESASAGVCDEQTEGCGPDPEHGYNVSKCKIWASWSYGVYSIPAVYGHFKCQKPIEHIELQVAVQLVLYGGLTGGQYKMIASGKKTWKEPAPNTEEKFFVDFSCTAHKWYRAWIYARSWIPGGTYWTAEALDGRLWECPASGMGNGANGVEEGAEPEPDGPDPGE